MVLIKLKLRLDFDNVCYQILVVDYRQDYKTGHHKCYLVLCWE